MYDKCENHIQDSWYKFGSPENCKHLLNTSVYIVNVYVYVCFSADVTSQVSSVSTNVIVTFSGNVTWLSMVIYKSSCSIDVKYFPFDEQNCTLEFASWTYDANAIKLVIVGDSGDISNYIPNSEWNLFKLEQKWRNITFSCCPEPYIFVSYSILMTRRPLFYLFNMVMPCVLITMVALLGFYMPSDSGEKVSMGITTLLSMTVFLMIVAENMPPTSDVVPLIGELVQNKTQILRYVHLHVGFKRWEGLVATCGLSGVSTGHCLGSSNQKDFRHIRENFLSMT